MNPSLTFIHRFKPSTTIPVAEAPTLLLLHGTGGDETDLLPLGERLAPTANLLSPRGQVLEWDMPRFFRRLAEGVFDQADLEQRTADLAEFITQAAGTYLFDTTKVIVVGYSNGANIGASLLLRYPTSLAGAVLLHAMVPFESEKISKLKGKPIFMGAGRHDPIIQPANTERLAAILQHGGADVTLHWQQGGHQLTLPEIVAAQQWLSQSNLLG